MVDPANLSWGIGETDNKNIAVSWLPDFEEESDETFLVQLDGYGAGKPP